MRKNLFVLLMCSLFIISCGQKPSDSIIETTIRKYYDTPISEFKIVDKKKLDNDRFEIDCLVVFDYGEGGLFRYQKEEITAFFNKFGNEFRLEKTEYGLYHIDGRVIKQYK